VISVDEAQRRILAAMHRTPDESVALAQAAGRVLAADIASRITQPPAAVSAMDGYAVLGADVHTAPITLKRVGEAAAGGSFDRVVQRGEAVRIFTGGTLPPGTDTVVLQENTVADGDSVTVTHMTFKGRHVRERGLDFREGDVLLRAGQRLGARQVGLAAAMNVPTVSVRARPRVAVLATGNELIQVGERLAPHRIVNANGPAITALLAASGAEVVDLGIARDDVGELTRAADRALGGDLLVTLGGASVGEHDLIQKALGGRGLDVDFWKVAIRPGKPLMFGKLGHMPVLGLPGNPVSAFVCALIFVRPAIAALQGALHPIEPPLHAVLGRDLDANDQRQDYLRAQVERRADGALIATPFAKQDSSMLRLLADAGGLVVRAPHAPPARTGDTVPLHLLGA
jgi:molybdopterin molybdotransferase